MCVQKDKEIGNIVTLYATKRRELGEKSELTTQAQRVNETFPDHTYYTQNIV